MIARIGITFLTEGWTGPDLPTWCPVPFTRELGCCGTTSFSG